MYQAILARNKFMIFRKCLYLVSLRFNIAILSFPVESNDNQIKGFFIAFIKTIFQDKLKTNCLTLYVSKEGLIRIKTKFPTFSCRNTERNAIAITYAKSPSFSI